MISLLEAEAINTFFTADTHFGHSNILKYSKRPYSDVHQMDEAIISNWNSVVKPGDTIYHLGDFGMLSDDDISKYIKRLKGNIVFIEGNHDKKTRRHAHEFYKYSNPYMEISVNGQSITLCHYAMRIWNKSHYGAWHLYGHSHGTLPDDPYSLSFDVGVDCWDFTPVSFDQVAGVMKTKLFVSIDHHGEEK